MLVIRLAWFVPLCALASCGGRTRLGTLTPVDAAAPGKDLSPTISPEPRPEAGPDSLVPRDLLADLPPDLSPDLMPDLSPDLPRTPDLPPAPPDLPTDPPLPRDLPSELPHDLPVDLRPDLPLVSGPDLARDPSPDRPATSDTALPITCSPTTELCNGLDDDCDGVVDNDIAPVPCPGGGFRYCVAGQMSACPSRCAVCVPGGQRVCFISYCSFWGLQTCASDGQSWGYCVEQRPVPPACAAVARDKKHDRATEQCCVENGFCCLDEFDLDGDGDTTEMIGRCGDVLCAN
jgi:hypothetical protein